MVYSIFRCLFTLLLFIMSSKNNVIIEIPCIVKKKHKESKHKKYMFISTNLKGTITLR